MPPSAIRSKPVHGTFAIGRANLGWSGRTILPSSFFTWLSIVGVTLGQGTPSATTSGASVTATTATLSGLLNANGAVSTAGFQWGATTNYGNLALTEPTN